MDTQFRLIVNDRLAAALTAGSTGAEMSTNVSPATKEQAFRLGLGDAITVVGYLIPAAKLLAVCLDLAKAVIAWRKKEKTPKVIIVVQGSRDDVVLTVDEKTGEVDLADRIHRTVSKD